MRRVHVVAIDVPSNSNDIWITPCARPCCTLVDSVVSVSTSAATAAAVATEYERLICLCKSLF